MYKRQVLLIESERGWGSKTFDIKLFTSDQAAKDFIEVYNSRNTERYAPDYYTYAEMGNVVEVENV